MCTWSKRPFPWLISISWKCSVTRMVEVVTQHSCAVLTARLHHRSWCWTTLVSLWAAPLCLLCRADRFMFITLNRDWEPIKKKKKVTDSHRFCVQRFPLNISQAPGNLNSLEINGSAMIDDLIGCCWFDNLIRVNGRIPVAFKRRVSFVAWCLLENILYFLNALCNSKIQCSES